MNIESIISLTKNSISNGYETQSETKELVYGKGRNQEFEYTENYINYFPHSKKSLENETEKDRFIYERAIETWGKNLHASENQEIPQSWHHDILRKHLVGIDLFKGDLILEIGCGEGFDILLAAKSNPNKNFIGLDIGENVQKISERDRSVKNLFYIRGDALNLPFRDGAIDSIVSYGVFHHTKNPHGCMKEAYRVLKPGGILSIYLYKNHEDNFFKYMGCVLESAIMRITSSISVKSGKLICKFIAPFVLIIFSWPAQILNRIYFTKNLAKKFPLHWGTTINSILPDLEDRLLASINFRFSFKEFKDLFSSNKFISIVTVTDSSGHYGSAFK